MSEELGAGITAEFKKDEKKPLSPVEKFKEGANSFTAELRRRLDNLPKVDWEGSNKENDSFNRMDQQRRAKEILSSDLKEYYKGDILGMAVLEGAIDVSIRDANIPEGDGIHEEVKRINVRLLLARNLPEASKTSSDGETIMTPESLLTKTPDTQYTQWSDFNDNLFASIVYEGIGQTTGVHGVTKNWDYQRETNEILLSLIDQYDKVNQSGQEYPLTIVFGHGDVGNDRKHFIFAGDSEIYPTDVVLNEVASKYPPPTGEKIPVILVSCNERNKKSATISNDKMTIAYKEGLAGFLQGTGELKLSNPS